MIEIGITIINVFPQRVIHLTANRCIIQSGKALHQERAEMAALGPMMVVVVVIVYGNCTSHPAGINPSRVTIRQ
jgi:hypothetical protein